MAFCQSCFLKQHCDQECNIPSFLHTVLLWDISKKATAVWYSTHHFIRLCKSFGTGVVTKRNVNSSRSSHLPILGLSICNILYFLCFLLCTHLSNLKVSVIKGEADHQTVAKGTSGTYSSLWWTQAIWLSTTPASVLHGSGEGRPGWRKPECCPSQAVAETIRNCQLERCGSEPSTAGLLISRCALQQWLPVNISRKGHFKRLAPELAEPVSLDSFREAVL